MTRDCSNARKSSCRQSDGKRGRRFSKRTPPSRRTSSSRMRIDPRAVRGGREKSRRDFTRTLVAVHVPPSRPMLSESPRRVRKVAEGVIGPGRGVERRRRIAKFSGARQTDGEAHGKAGQGKGSIACRPAWKVCDLGNGHAVHYAVVFACTVSEVMSLH